MRDKETGLANGNYTQGSSTQSELRPSHTKLFGCGQVDTNLPPLPPFTPPLSGWARWLPTPHSRWVTPVEQYLRGLCSRQAWWTQWTLEQPPVPLSGILYELGQSQQDQDLQCEATVKGTSGLVANRLTNLQAARNQSAQQVSQNPFCIYTL